MSDSLRSHGLQPARLLCPWDSPGKNTGVGCHFLLQGSSQTRVKPALAGGFLMTGPPGRSCMTYFEVKHLRKRTRSGLRTQEPKICNSAKNTPGDFKVIMMTSHLVFGARPFSVTFQCNTCNTPTSVTCYCHDHFLEVKKKFFLTLLSLHCGMWDLVSWPGIEPGPLHWEHRILTTGLPGKSCCGMANYTEVGPKTRSVTTVQIQALLLASFLNHLHSSKLNKTCIGSWERLNCLFFFF